MLYYKQKYEIKYAIILHIATRKQGLENVMQNLGKYSKSLRVTLGSFIFNTYLT